MKKILALLVVLGVVYFGLRMFSPATLDRIAFWKKTPVVQPMTLPPAEPAPKLDSAITPIEPAPVVAKTEPAKATPTPAPAPAASIAPLREARCRSDPSRGC